MKITVLDGNAVNPGDLSWDILKQFSSDITIYPRTSPESVIERIGNSDVIFLNKINITEDILSSCPSVKYIGVLATGYNVIDLEATKKRTITVTNIPSYSTNAVAQHVFAFITYFTNHVAIHNESVHNGDWIKNPDFCYWKEPLMELNGKTIGIFGYGNIGQKVAKIALAFGMNVICTSRTKKENVQNVSFDELLEKSDFLTLHAPLTDLTKKIINSKSLSKMKRTSFLINTARGGFVDENDLYKALKDGIIKGYACDVLEEEPMSSSSPLIHAPNCVITPHIAWAPKETRIRLQNIAVDNLKNWINKNPTNVVN
jgi:glycerate dehydrogenase